MVVFFRIKHIMLSFQRQFRQLNQAYRPLGAPQSNQLGVLKRLQLANMIFVN